ncbi:AAA family ATPase [Tsukamurella tyrosinosolvens]|uniref:AAA family ATPase n=1 Tax=Tsukamurella tyrosinosolvens TaxID=57704 RepID=UPI002DD42E9C|nr:AAA family ATPase [Tsukamurella tyrosinosolvens]MEC4613628.1 AAA family ATPase [Tsukamurella tyrosinosolvens]
MWLNGGFGAGKTTLAGELHRRLPEAVVFDPEELGITLWRWVPRNDDFQDLASWRELVVSTALALRRHHADVLIVPMALVRDDYREEILAGLTAAGEVVLHVFLDVDLAVQKRRLLDRVPEGEASSEAEEWAFSRLDPEAVARQPEGTLILRSDRLSPGDLAEAVLAALPE